MNHTSRKHAAPPLTAHLLTIVEFKGNGHVLRRIQPSVVLVLSDLVTQIPDLPVKIFVLARKECIQTVFVLWRELVRTILLEPQPG